MITINWVTKVINIPQSYLTATAMPMRYTMDLESFHSDLRGLEASEEGMPWETTHDYSGSTLVGNTNLAPVVSIINGYTIEFEDALYEVSLLGANSNLSNVKVFNSVSLSTNNSAGLVVVESIDTKKIIGHIWGSR